jgi:hypothetical protein
MFLQSEDEEGPKDEECPKYEEGIDNSSINL